MDIFDVIEQNDIQSIKQIIHQDPSIIHHRNNFYVTPLHWACQRGCTEIAQLLINTGTDVHVKDKSGWTPLHMACDCGHTDVAKLLIDAGADVNAKSDQKWAPLHVACYHGFKELAQLCIEADDNVDWLVVNKNGQTPIDLAIDNNETEFLYFLEGFIDQLPSLEQKKLHTWRFREELTKTS